MGFKEECWIIYGVKIGKKYYGYQVFESEGSPASVDFNWEKVFRDKDKIIGFNHTHPGGMNLPSDTDDFTMTGWVKALGKPLLCGIVGSEQWMHSYARGSDKVVHSQRLPVKRYGNFFIVNTL